MDVFIVLSSSSEAEALNNRITFDMEPHWTDGVTDNYCNVIKHPTQDLWAVIVQPGYEQHFTQSELNSAQELTEDWIFNSDI
jgi:hypothetical protein